MAKKEDIYQLSWNEYFEKELDVLCKKVQSYVEKNKVTINAVVPLLRGGNIPGTYLAYKLSVLRIVPVQYKYFFKKNTCDLLQIQKVNEELFNKEEKLTFLLVEGNHCYGTAAMYAAKGLKKQFPNCKIIYAASNMDYNYKNAVDKYAEVSFFGRYNNDCEELTKEKCRELKIEVGKINIFPWESPEEEWTTFGELKQFSFKDAKSAESKAKLCETIDLSTFRE